MDNAYVHGLRQYDSRPRSPVVVPRDMSALRKKILFENTLLEERALHEFSAGKGDGAGVDTGSAPLKPLTSPTPSPTPTPTPAPAGIPVATTNTINVVDTFNVGQTISLTKFSSTEYRTDAYSNILGQVYCEAYSDNVNIYIFRIQLIKESNYWIYRYIGFYNCEDNAIINYDNASVQQITNGIIPTTGWTPALSITAA